MKISNKDIIMTSFDDYEEYLEALKKKPNLAVLPVAAAAKVMFVGPATVKNWIRTGKVSGISIAGDKYAKASSIRKKVNKRNSIAQRVKERLIGILKEERRFVFYAEIMEEFGFDYRIHPDRTAFGWMLGRASRLSQDEMEAALGEGNGGLLSAVVWRKDTEFVGAGFWDLLHNMGIEEPSDEDAEGFVEEHIDSCIEFYT